MASGASAATTTGSRTLASTPLPPGDVDIVVAAGGPEAAELAAEIGDGLVTTAPDPSLVERYVAKGGGGVRYAS